MPKPTTRYATRSTAAGSHQIAYRVDGPTKGVPIVLQHGWTSSKESWAGYVRVFNDAGYRCVSVDSLGHGESDTPTERAPYEREARASDIVAVMDISRESGLPSVSLLGAD